MKSPSKKQLESEISAIKKVVDNPSTPDNIRKAVEPTLKKLEKLLSDLEAAQKKDVKIEEKVKVEEKKAKVKEVKKPAPAPAAKKHVGKQKAAPKPAPAKKVVPQAVKKVHVAAKKSKKNIASISKKAHELLAQLTAKIKSFNRGRSKEDIERDSQRTANKPGWKKSKTTGKWYYEDRANRTDASGRKKPHLAEGGEVGGLYDIVDLNNEIIEQGLTQQQIIDWADTLQWYELMDIKEEEGIPEIQDFESAKVAISFGGDAKVVPTGESYASGGQTPPQGHKYTWQADKVNPGAAKHVGWRYTDEGAAKLKVGAKKVPTQAHIDEYSGRTFRKNGVFHRYVYRETRKDKSDISQRKRLDEGGVFDLFEQHSYASGGQTHPQGDNWTWQADKVNPGAAKPVGWRYTDEGANRLGVSTNKVPTNDHIERYANKIFHTKGKEHRYVYQETRKDKSDVSQRKHLAGGGTVGSTGESPSMNQEAFLQIIESIISCQGRIESGTEVQEAFGWLRGELEEINNGIAVNDTTESGRHSR